MFRSCAMLLYVRSQLCKGRHPQGRATVVVYLVVVRVYTSSVASVASVVSYPIRRVLYASGLFGPFFRPTICFVSSSDFSFVWSHLGGLSYVFAYVVCCLGPFLMLQLGLLSSVRAPKCVVVCHVLFQGASNGVCSRSTTFASLLQVVFV